MEDVELVKSSTPGVGEEMAEEGKGELEVMGNEVVENVNESVDVVEESGAAVEDEVEDKFEAIDESMKPEEAVEQDVTEEASEAVATNEIPEEKEHALLAEQPGPVSEDPLAATEDPAVTTEEPMVAPEYPAVASEEPIVAPEEPIVAPEEPMVALDEPVVASEEVVNTVVAEEPVGFVEESKEIPAEITEVAEKEEVVAFKEESPMDETDAVAPAEVVATEAIVTAMPAEGTEAEVQPESETIEPKEESIVAAAAVATEEAPKIEETPAPVDAPVPEGEAAGVPATEAAPVPAVVEVPLDPKVEAANKLREYLSELQPLLSSALAEMARATPADPITFVVEYLRKNNPNPPPPPPKRVVFVLGGPGAGKGTQSSRIVADYGWDHVSAGDLLRDEVQSKSKEGRMIGQMIKDGQIVPGHITVGLLKKAVEKSTAPGILVDGFPRKIDQAGMFEKMVGPAEFVLFFDCSEKTMEDRLLERGKTSGRSDDNIKSIKKRFKTFVDQSMPVISYYSAKKMVRKIDASKPVDQVYKEVQKLFGTPLPKKDPIPPAAEPQTSVDAASGKATISSTTADAAGQTVPNSTPEVGEAPVLDTPPAPPAAEPEPMAV